jgi:hypothetical protein
MRPEATFVDGVMFLEFVTTFTCSNSHSDLVLLFDLNSIDLQGQPRRRRRQKI